MRIGIGIDTGGTYTDAVVYDFDTQCVLKTVKALTTRQDLSRGILEALDGIPRELLVETEILSLSTTLATNACVENKGGNAKLIIFGGDKRSIDTQGASYGLPLSKEIYLQESYTTFSGESKREVDWELFCRELENGYEHLDCLGIVEINATRNGAATEKKAKQLFQKRFDTPVICGHELFSKLNYLQRGSSTLLNARLYPVIKEFLAAIKKAVAERDIKAKLIVMRSDGSVMSEEFASLHPIETLLCGPAASALGGLHLSEERNGVVVDMGGTTTDISLIKEGVPQSIEGGISLGTWKTFVNGLYNKTIGLGGDSALHYRNKKAYLEEYRVVPLCVAASTHPVIIDNLRALGERATHTRFIHEHVLLVKDIDSSSRYTEREKDLCRALKQEPLMLPDAAAVVGKDVYNFNVARLVKEGVVQLCGLTPTDIMHIRGDFSRYSTEAARLGATFVARNVGLSIDELCTCVYREIRRKLYLNIVKVLLEQEHTRYKVHGVPDEVEQLINDSFESAERRLTKQNSDGRGGLSNSFATSFTLLGTGAPIGVFLDEVAQMLGTRAVIPKNNEVANAIGAITGNVAATCTIEVSQVELGSFIVHGAQGSRTFRGQKDAETFAAEQAELGARQEALARGARGELTVFCTVEQHQAEAKETTVYLGSSVTARAVGGILG